MLFSTNKPKHLTFKYQHLNSNKKINIPQNSYIITCLILNIYSNKKYRKLTAWRKFSEQTLLI